MPRPKFYRFLPLVYTICLPGLCLEQLVGVPQSLGWRYYNIYRLHGWPFAYQLRWGWDDFNSRAKSSPWPWLPAERVELFQPALWFDIACLAAMLGILCVAIFRVRQPDQKLLHACAMLTLAGIVTHSAYKAWAYYPPFDWWNYAIDIPHRAVAGYLLAELVTWGIHLARRRQFRVRDLLVMATLTAVTASIVGSRLTPSQGEQSSVREIVNVSGSQFGGLLLFGEPVLLRSSPESSSIEELPWGSVWLSPFLRNSVSAEELKSKG